MFLCFITELVRPCVDWESSLPLNFKMRIINGLGLLAILLCVGSPGAFASEKSMSFRLVEDCAGNRCHLALLGEGVITQETFNDLALVAPRHPGVQTLLLHSPGGNLGGGLKLGMRIRSLGLNTSIPDGMRCMSACAYAFLGGNRREVRQGGLIGVHRFHSTRYVNEDVAQVAVSVLNEYVISMGASRKLVDVAAQAGKEAMIGIDTRAAQELRVDNTDADPARWSLQHLDGMLLVSGSGLDAGSDRVATVMAGEGENAIVVAMGVTYEKFRYTEGGGKFMLGMCVENDRECLSVSVPAEVRPDDQFNLVLFAIPKDAFYDFLNTHSNSRYISFILQEGEEETFVYGDMEMFKVLFQRTGSAGNYIKVK